ncbi:MAG: ferric iron reductase [Chloroflexota bacterium]
MNSTHPISTTINRIAQPLGYLNLQLGIDEGHWVNLTDLFHPNSAHLPALSKDISQKFGTKARNTVASILLQSFHWRVMTAAIAAYILDQRVIDLQPEQVSLRLSNTHEFDAIALRSPLFTALPNDPAAQSADATIVPNAAALQDVLGEALQQHFTTVIGALTVSLGCKPRGLWLNVADSLVGTLIYLQPLLNENCEVEKISQMIGQINCVPKKWLISKRSGLLTVESNGQRKPYLDRLTCCQYYRRSNIYCGTCPRLSYEERQQNQLAHL